jgi:hypothetical protein
MAARAAFIVNLHSKIFSVSTSLLLLATACTTNQTSSGANNQNPDGGPTAPGDTKADGDGGAVSGINTRFFVPTGEPDNIGTPTVEVDAQGNTHMVYPAYAGGGAYYAFCPANCASATDSKVVRFDTEGTVANAMLTLDAQGRPRVLLAAYAKIYFASCDANCGDKASWKSGVILEHGSDREVSGEAMGLDPQGRPRFIMHTYRAYLGIGQKPPKTFYVTCDAADCTTPASWQSSEIAAEDIWYGSQLRFDAQGHPRVATVAPVLVDGTKRDMAVYYECTGDCTKEENWNGVGFGSVYESETEAVSMHAAMSLALTKGGAPRVAYIGKTDEGKKVIPYSGCDHDCTVGDNWKATIVANDDKIHSGLDLSLDANDFPRLAITLNYNVGLAYCDDAHCEEGKTKWGLTKVEAGSDIRPDDIFLYKNCTVGAWFLHDPSLALTAGGQLRVIYQARDVSGGPKPGCVVGTDMVLGRLASLTAVQ